MLVTPLKHARMSPVSHVQILQQWPIAPPCTSNVTYTDLTVVNGVVGVTCIRMLPDGCYVALQMGCYVPASAATLEPVDRIFTRLGVLDT